MDSQTPPFNRDYFDRLGKGQRALHDTRPKHRTIEETFARCDQLRRMANKDKSDEHWMVGHLRYRTRSLERQARLADQHAL